MIILHDVWKAHVLRHFHCCLRYANAGSDEPHKPLKTGNNLVTVVEWFKNVPNVMGNLVNYILGGGGSETLCCSRLANIDLCLRSSANWTGSPTHTFTHSNSRTLTHTHTHTHTLSHGHTHMALESAAHHSRGAGCFIMFIMCSSEVL